MRLRAIWGDLLLLVDLLLHPVRQWRTWRSITAGFLSEGGATITTPAPTEAQTIVARTLIQPDGDVLVMVDPRFVHADALLARHSQQVAQWFDRSRSSMHQATMAVRALILAVSGAAAVESGWSAFARVHGIVGGAAGLVASVVVFPVVRLLLGRLASFVVRRKVDRWIGGAGAPG